MISISSHLENNLPSDTNLASEYALRVALETMRERCISLQRRLNIVEKENSTLKNDNLERKLSPKNTERSICFELRQKILELTKEKHQLTEHVAIVATENRQLWSRLSQLTKRKVTVINSTNENLNQSKVFAQNLNRKSLQQQNLETRQYSFDELGLEGTSLKMFSHYANIKSEQGENDKFLEFDMDNGFLFSFLHNKSDADLLYDTKKCNETVEDIKNGLLKQQNSLKMMLSNFNEENGTGECFNCEKRNKTETRDKSLETEDVTFVELNSTLYNKNAAINKYDLSGDLPERTNINIFPEEKMCPLCGKVFSSVIAFEDFRDHVEMHFIGDNEFDSNIERNYEIISHSVGNF